MGDLYFQVRPSLRHEHKSKLYENNQMSTLVNINKSKYYNWPCVLLKSSLPLLKLSKLYCFHLLWHNSAVLSSLDAGFIAHIVNYDQMKKEYYHKFQAEVQYCWNVFSIVKDSTV